MSLSSRCWSCSSSSPPMTRADEAMIRSLRSLPLKVELLDVKLLLQGIDDTKERAIYRANSTILALRSNFFKKAFYEDGQNEEIESGISIAVERGRDRKWLVRIVGDPDALEIVIVFIGGCSLDQNGTNTGDVARLNFQDPFSFQTFAQAFTVRREAKRLEVNDLVELTEKFILGSVGYSNAIKVLILANAHDCRDLKPLIFQVIQNRGKAIFTRLDDRVHELEAEDIVTLAIQFKDNVKADLLIDFLRFWGDAKMGNDFPNFFQREIYEHLNWSNVSKGYMRKVYDLNLLTADQLFTCIFPRMMDVFDKEKPESVLQSQMKVQVKLSSKNKEMKLRGLVIRMAPVGDEKRLGLMSSTLIKGAHRYFLDLAGKEMISGILGKVVDVYAIEDKDVSVTIDLKKSCHKINKEKNVPVKVRSVLACFGDETEAKEESILLAVTFDPIVCNYKDCWTDVKIGVRVQENLLKDLTQGILHGMERTFNIGSNEEDAKKNMGRITCHTLAIIRNDVPNPKKMGFNWPKRQMQGKKETQKEWFPVISLLDVFCA